MIFGHLPFETNGNIGIFLPGSQNLEGCSSQVKVSTDASVNFKRNEWDIWSAVNYSNVLLEADSIPSMKECLIYGIFYKELLIWTFVASRPVPKRGPFNNEISTIFLMTLYLKRFIKEQQ